MRVGSFAIAALLSSAAFGQPKFDLADVHPSPPSTTNIGSFMRSGFYHGGRYEIHSASMIDFVRTAYGMDPDKVLGGPSWVAMDRFDVIAKAPPDTTPADLKLMLQALLAERFNLVVHRDKKDLPTYALRLGKKPLLKEASGSGDSGCKPQAPNGPVFFSFMMNGVAAQAGSDLSLSYSCKNVTMAAFVDALHSMPFAGVGNNPLVDETGLKGSWDFDFKFTLGLNMGPNAPQTTKVTIFDAVDKQLGLKLESINAPLPVIVIDSVNKTPSANAPGVSQSLPELPTEFEVADVKPSDPNPQGPMMGGRGVQPGGRVNYRNITLKQLVTQAYGVTPDKVVGGPKFMDTDRFDILAKAPASAMATTGNQIDDEALQLMMRALLADRFKLAVHTEDQRVDTYVLVAAKPKLKAADPAGRTGCNEGPGADGKDPRIANPSLGRLTTCLNMTMAQFADQLPKVAGGYFMQIRTVVDGTGLEGSYDFTLSYSANGFQNRGAGGRGMPLVAAGPISAGEPAEAADPGQGLSLLDALEKQLGLKLETQKRPMPVIVIDRVEQKPTDN